MRFLALALALLIGCGDDGAPAMPDTPTDPPKPPAATTTTTAGREPTVDPPDPDLTDFRFTGELGQALADAGAVPAWQAVIDRHRWLERRGARGSIWGRLAAADDGHRWLIDETEGAGALAARALLPPGMALADGDRAVLHGAWAVDDRRRWFWRVTAAARLPAAPAAGDDPLAAPAPGHDVRSIDGIDAQPVGRVDNRGGVIWFEVVRGPRRPGDGWVIAERSHFPPVAVLHLPGERDPYGGQDHLTPDERWRLAPRVRYVVRVGKSRPPRKADDLRQLQALTAPRRLGSKDPG